MLSAEELLSALTADNSTARQEFREALAGDLAAVEKACLIAFPSVDRMNLLGTEGLAAEHTRAFFHASFNSLVTSTNLLVAGFPLPSGHMMRHFGECIAIALLCLDSASNTAADLERQGSSFPAHDAVSRLRRPKQWRRIQQLIGAPDDGWATFGDLDRLWAHFSHAGAFALGFHLKMSAPGSMVVGAEFDSSKVDQFKADLRWRRSGFLALRDIVGLAYPQVARLWGTQPPNAVPPGSAA